MKRKAVSPLVATLVLIIASLALGGLLFTQFRSLVAAGASTPYIDVIDYSVNSDGSVFTLTIKNTVNEPVNIVKVYVGSAEYSKGGNNVVFYPDNNSWKLSPGETGVIKMSGSFPTSGELTVVIVGDKFSRSFTLPL